MSTVKVEIDDIQEQIADRITDDDVELDDLVQAIFDDGLHRLYKQWKSAGQVEIKEEIDEPE